MVPQHIAIIMDGNNRWARRRGMPVSAGHAAGMEAIRTALQACDRQGVKILTLFAFSSENWGRPRPEVRSLLALFARYLRNETRALHEDGVRIRFIGQRSRFSRWLQQLMREAEQRTLANSATTLVIAADYGGQWDIALAARRLARRHAAGTLDAADITAQMLDREISLADLPRPDLCIRTGGDHRISNFMLWQFAYSELYFTETLWPDFDADELERALHDFRGRERRFGMRANCAAEQPACAEPEPLARVGKKDEVSSDA